MPKHTLLHLSTMSDETSVTIDLREKMPLVQSINNANGNGLNQQNLSTSGNKSQASTPQTPTANMSNSNFIVGTKANQSIISDTPVTDPGGNTTKQVCISIL